MDKQSEIDVSFMKQTMEVALLGSGFVNPAPLEGGLVVVGGQEVFSTYRKAPNDEQVTMKVLKELETHAYENVTLYLNIEPELEPEAERESMSEFVSQLMNNGLKKIVVGLEVLPETDSFLNACSQAGIEVVRNVLGQECTELNEIYLHFRRHKTPFVFVKWAMTLDGKLATKTGDSKWISSADSLKFVHHLRQRVAAIMVGEGTVRMDNPLLTTRLEGVEISNPLRVILTKRGEIQDDAHVLEVSDTVKTLLLVSENISPKREAFLKGKGVEILKFPEHNGRIVFKEIMVALGQIGVDSLYIEGGSGVLGEAFESGIVHKVYTAIAPKIVGGRDAYTPVAGVGIEHMANAIELRNVSHEIIGRDVIIKGYI